MSNHTAKNLLRVLPEINHPTINAMRVSLQQPKISISVHLYHNRACVYTAHVEMFGHSHALYLTAFDAVTDDLAKRGVNIDWDEVSFLSPSALRHQRIHCAVQPGTLAAYVHTARSSGFDAALQNVVTQITEIKSGKDRTAIATAIDDSFLQLCAAIISTSISVIPDASFMPKRKIIFDRLRKKPRRQG